MQVTNELIYKLADLSGLKVKEENLESLKADLHNMIAFVDKLQELKVDDLQPLQFLGQEKTSFRLDEAQPSLPVNEALREAPMHDEQYFLVPKVIQKAK